MNEYKTKEQKKQFYNSGNWKHLREAALKRDNYECQQCKREGKVHLDSTKDGEAKKKIELNVHHKKEIEYHPDLAYELDNLETLCLYHHNAEHDRFTKSKPNIWEEDERW
ncbi:hypothetical protein BhaS171_00004 [Bacillus phage vB_BhaS-171]|uniref:HNH endonuclease n=1 Tax=Bacillus phage vB_BhaS-171 TaxID=1775140 RepID=UPI000744C82B|nr:HNH endonuclease [Bacillus phage vB_BhaS-171]ALY08060.1 hypothetical protein BhaS171_00004 [Bacillus phage vB_BhaS-171]